MKKVMSFFALTAAGVCCVAAAYFCQFYYYRYHDAVTGLEGRINSFDLRLAELESHKSRELTPVRVWGLISTSDRPADEFMHSYLSSKKRPDNFYEVAGAKGGSCILPELRLPVNSTTNTTFDIQIDKGQYGLVADAWFSHAEPYQDLAAFEHFWVYCPNGTNLVRLIVRPKTNASIQMRFNLVVLHEK